MDKTRFKFDKKLKLKEYSSKYFIITQKIFKENNLGKDVTLRFFSFHDNTCLAGIYEVLELLKYTISKRKLKTLKIWFLKDGTIIKKEQPVLIIRGDYQLFGHLENIIDGILSRRSSIATNCYKAIKEVGSNRLFFMGDRSDDYTLQKFDGYSAYIGGVKNFCTKQHIEYIKNKNDVNYLGTIPHALIQQFNGELDKALIKYKELSCGPIVALVDYNNDCLTEIEKISKLNFDVDYIRIDTSSKLVDKSLQNGNWKKNKSLYGVNKKLIKLCREKLNSLGMKKTKIIISSGLTLESIKQYENEKKLVDIYGLGKSLLNININFTGDLIKTNDKYEAKVGRNNNIDNQIKKMEKFHI